MRRRWYRTMAARVTEILSALEINLNTDPKQSDGSLIVAGEFGIDKNKQICFESYGSRPWRLVNIMERNSTESIISTCARIGRVQGGNFIYAPFGIAQQGFSRCAFESQTH